MSRLDIKIRRTLLIGFFALASLGVLLAQISTGVIVGQVKDITGAVLADATVQIVNSATGLNQSVKTNSDGFYRSPDLPPGAYDILMAHPGFKSADVKGVTLQINQTARVDITAELGAVTEHVEVQSSAPLLQTETSSTGQVIQNQTIVNLPLNGRNYLDLTKLVPGVAQAQAGRGSEITQKVGASWALVINGGRTENSDYVLDGISAKNYFVGTGNLLPSVDSIQEFKVQQNSFSAEFGFGLAVVNSVMKSGTNGFHGGAFEFLRNNDLDASNFFANATGSPRAPLHRNQFGTTFGGPIKRNKAFFFVNWESMREHRGSTPLGVVPTLGQRVGDFSGPGNPTIINPSTGLPFSGNIIPPQFISQFGAAAIRYYPLPNTNQVGANVVRSLTDQTTFDQYGLKGDVNLTSKDTLTMHFQYENYFNTAYNVMPLTGQLYPVATRNGGFSEIHVFTPTLVNEFRAGYNFGDVEAVQEITATNVAQAEFGLKNTSTYQPYWGLPAVTVAGLSSLGNANGGNRPEGGKNNIFEFADNLTWNRGRQTIKTGFDIRPMVYKGQTGVPRGLANFTGQFSGVNGKASTSSAVADLLLGATANVSASQGDNIAYMVSTSFGAYVQDDIRVRPNLTVNIGLRWEYYQPPVDVNGQNRQVNYDRFAGQFLLVSQGQIRPGIIKPDYKNFDPRVGFAWTVRPKTVVRAGAALFANGMNLQGNEAVFMHDQVPYRTSIAINSNPTVPSINLATDVFPPVPPCSIACFPKLNPNPLLSGWFYDQEPITPYVEQWNFALQREILPNLMLETAYVGSHGVHLWGRYQPNQALQDVNLNAPTASQGRRPYPFIGNITGDIPALSSWYNALQVKAEKRLSQGLLFLASYTYAKNLDMQASTAGDTFTNNYNWALNKGLSPNNIKSRFVLSGVWEVPVGQHKRFGSNFGRAFDAALGNWSVNWIWSLQTGNPIDIRSNVNTNLVNGVSRPNNICDPTLTSGSFTGPTRFQWINTSCFVAQPLGTIGNSGRYTVIGPGRNNWDFSLFKTFILLPENRMNLEFRTEFFNGFNHTQFIGPDTWTIPSATFGVITQAADPREMQFGLKLNF